MRIYVAALEALSKNERQDETQFKTRPKLVEKLIWVPVISFCKIFIPSYTLDALLSQNWPFLPPNRITLRITLMKGLHFMCYYLTSYQGCFHKQLFFSILLLGRLLAIKSYAFKDLLELLQGCCEI
jgi:hypothetical protein